MCDETERELERKLEILRARAKAYEDFVSPPGQPPLLWQMAMLAAAGFTILPAVRDPDPRQSFPEMTVSMAELEWSDECQCLVGGETFEVMAVPESHHGHLLRPKQTQPTYYAAASTDPVPVGFDVEHYRRRDMVLRVGGVVVWRSRIMVCIGSRAERSGAELRR